MPYAPKYAVFLPLYREEWGSIGLRMSEQDVKVPAVPSARGPSLFGLLRSYRAWVALLVTLALLSHGIGLVMPLIVSRGIDAFSAGAFDLRLTIIEFSAAAASVLVCTYLLSLVQVYVSELVARDLRTELAASVSRQSHAFVQRMGSSLLLTNLTSDIDAVKMFVSQAIATFVSSLSIIIGSAVLLLLIDVPLALVVLLIVPLIGGVLFFIFRQMRVLFKKGQEVIDWLNKVINESILGAALIRVIDSRSLEEAKFHEANSRATGVALQLLGLFSVLIPVVWLISGLATIAILLLGGHFVIDGSLTIGEFSAFNSYLGMLIFPMFMLSFIGNVTARASASYKRVTDVLNAEPEPEGGTLQAALRGDVQLKDVSMAYGEKNVLKGVSFSVPAGSRTAIIGPTGAGKSQLLYALTALTRPAKGEILFDGRSIGEYDPVSLHAQVAFVFQDSVVLNMTIRENIAFSPDATDQALQKAIRVAELQDFVASLPLGLDTVISERGGNVSGGQKQRIMLARALALNPKVLLLDDFTARVDAQTEQKILTNLAREYPGLTLISVTQKIASVEQYDQIILLMEGEILAIGTHAHLMKTSPEYVQIADSQRSTSAYELRPE